MPARLFFLFVSACLMTAAPLFAQTEGDFKNVQREIYRSWIAYLNSLDSVSGKYETHDTYPDGPDESTACRFVYSYPFIKVEQIGAENAVETISVYNAKYHFRLQTASPETAIENISDMRPFKGTKDVWFDNNNILQNVTSSRLNSAKLYLLGASLRLFPFWLPPLMKDDRFAITNIEYRSEEGEKTAVVTFANGNPIEENSNLWLVKGTLTLLPDHYWLPVKAEAQILEGEEGTITVENRYDFSHSVPILAEQTRSWTKPSESGTGRITVSDVRENVAVDPEEFTLSHYGFSEPDFNGARLNPVRIALICLNICLITLAILKFRRYRLTAKKQQNDNE